MSEDLNFYFRSVMAYCCELEQVITTLSLSFFTCKMGTVIPTF